MTQRKPYHKRGLPVEGYWPVRKHPLYNTWASIVSRCCNEKFVGYANYGGRGITICEKWRNSFGDFVQDMGSKPSDLHTVERKDNNGNYEPSNCKWGTRTEQCFNRRKFKNNTSGYVGVKKVKTRFFAVFDYEGVRYDIGRFGSALDAKVARIKFEALFFSDRSAAIESISKPTIWETSSTKIRGVTKHKAGGYTVRVTLNGTRYYIGYFADIDEATNARDRFIASATGKAQS